MRKYIRYILSIRHEAKLRKQHIERLHKMSNDDIIGIALWHCKDWLEFRKPMTLEQRLNLTISLPAPTAGELLASVQTVYDAITYPGERYIKALPSWCGGQSVVKVADSWLVDTDGYFVELETVVKQLHDQLETIHAAVNDPANEDYKYHYTKKPKAIYTTVTALLKHFH